MKEEKPATIAHRIETEVDDVGRLKQRRPGLFWAAAIAAILFGLGWAHEHFWGKAELEKALTVEQQNVRDLRSQLTLAETRLSPFKAIAIDRYGDDSGRTLVRLGQDMQRFQTELEALTTKLIAAERSAADAREMAEIASARQTPRTLSSEAKQAMAYVVSKTPARSKILIACRASDAEAEDFAKAIASVFGELGFPNQVDTLHGWNFPRGLSLGSNHPDHGLVELFDFALTRAGVHFERIALETITPPLPHPPPILLVGSKREGTR